MSGSHEAVVGSRSRRAFLRKGIAGAAASAFPTIIPCSVLGANAPSNRITMGCIGVGRMGRGDMRSFMGFKQLQVLAVCDVDANRAEDALALVEKTYAARTPSGSWKGCISYGDFREVTARADIDAVMVCTPDHWHVLPALAAVRAGKDAFVQKPLSLTIEEGGKPRADIAQGEVAWDGEMNRVVSVPLGGKFCFSAIVTNEGTVPIRTTGPWPGQEYAFSQNYNTLAVDGHDEWFQQAGVWRFGINFDTTGIDFPFRWAIGRPEDLERRIIDGVEQWYLLPGQSGEVSGCITMDEQPPVGTNFWWAGLIHEFVGVANNYVDRISVDVGVP